MTDETPSIIRLDDLTHTRHFHEFVGVEHGDVPFSIILVRSEPGVGPRLHRHPYAEVFADPTMTFHLKGPVKADLPAKARILADPAEREAVLRRIAQAWRRTDVDTMVRWSPLIEVVIDGF